MKSTYYHISDSTFIKLISLKELISDVRTKAELGEYLAKKAVSFSRSIENKLNKFFVTYDTIIEGNDAVLPNLIGHNHEEADTLLILHAASLDLKAMLLFTQLPQINYLKTFGLRMGKEKT